MKLSLNIQQVLLAHLAGNAPLTTALGGVHVYDEPPHPSSGIAAGTYLVLGDESVTAWSTQTTDGTDHQITLTLWSATKGYATIKSAMAALYDALEGNTLLLTGGTMISLHFLSARTSREAKGRLRRADCRFRLLVEHAPDK